MPREVQDVTEAELALLQDLWDRGRCSTRQITEVLYPGGGAAQYSTVQKLLERLEAKGFVARDRSLFVHTSAVMPIQTAKDEFGYTLVTQWRTIALSHMVEFADIEPPSTKRKRTA